MLRARPPASASRLAPCAARRAASASIWRRGPLHQRRAAASERAASSTTSGASAAKSRGCAEPIQRTMACGFDPNALEDAPEQRGPFGASVVRLERPAHGLAAEPGAAALVRDREAPAADAVVPAAEDRPADAAGADDDDAAVPAAMGADAGRMRVGGDQHAPEGVVASSSVPRRLRRARWHPRAPGRRRSGIVDRQAGLRPGTAGWHRARRRRPRPARGEGLPAPRRRRRAGFRQRRTRRARQRVPPPSTPRKK